MGFIGLVTWSGIRGLWKKGLEAQKVFEGYIWARTSRTLFVPFGLGSTPFVLCINLPLHFCAFLAAFGDLLSLFFTCLWRNLSFHYRPTSCICCLHCSLAVVPTHGFYFCFCHFFFVVVFRKQHDLARRGVAKDILVFGILKHGHVSFLILTRSFL